MLALRHATPPQWAAIALADIDAFLRDHAANERKVSGSAMWLAVHFPEHDELVDAMIDLAREELSHFRLVYDLLRERGCGLGQDYPDPYMGRLHERIRKGVMREHLLDRLLVFAIVEARGCERFRLFAEALPEGRLRDVYTGLVGAEARHHAIFLRLARLYFEPADIDARLDRLLDDEAAISRTLPLRPALH